MSSIIYFLSGVKQKNQYQIGLLILSGSFGTSVVGHIQSACSMRQCLQYSHPTVIGAPVVGTLSTWLLASPSCDLIVV